MALFSCQHKCTKQLTKLFCFCLFLSSQQTYKGCNWNWDEVKIVLHLWASLHEQKQLNILFFKKHFATTITKLLFSVVTIQHRCFKSSNPWSQLRILNHLKVN